MASAEPLSVLLPVRNGESTIQAAVSDLLAAMKAEDELFVIDDGSDDSTPILLTAAAATDSRVRVETTGGVGLVDALNLGLREARYDWIARADSDDRYPSSRLEVQRAAIAPDVALVAGDYRVVHEGRVIGGFPCALTAPFVAASLIHPQRIPHPGVVLNRVAVAEAGSYQSTDFPAEDLALWLRLAHVGQFVGVPAIVVDWTMHASSVSHSRQALQRSKTREILADWKAPQPLLEIDSAAVERELQAFIATTFANERRLLLVRDLLALRAYGVRKEAVGAAIRGAGLDPLGAIRALERLVRQRRRRSRLRSRFDESQL